jgi:glycosyltransferase involved in cell wall biosynthesis
MASSAFAGDLGRMRIVISNSSSKWGGVHTVTEVLARGLTERGHEVAVFGYPGGMLETRMQTIVPFEPILKGMDMHPLTMTRAARALRKYRADVVLTMMKKDVRLTGPAAKALGIPVVVRHANDRPLRGTLYDRVFFGMLPAHHIVNSVATRNTLLSSAPWIDRAKVTVVYNGIDHRRFETATPTDLGLPANAFVFGFVGRLEVRKGLIDLAIAWREVANALPEAWLVIAGKGADERQARELLTGVKNVKWLGYRTDVPEILASFDVLVAPSHWEGFGLVAAEGLAARVPVIATRASSLPEIIDDGVNGRLVPPRDPKSLTDALIEAAGDDAANLRMVEAGVSKVRCDFSVERMIERYESVLTQVA